MLKKTNVASIACSSGVRNNSEESTSKFCNRLDKTSMPENNHPLVSAETDSIRRKRQNISGNYTNRSLISDDSRWS